MVVSIWSCRSAAKCERRQISTDDRAGHQCAVRGTSTGAQHACAGLADRPATGALFSTTITRAEILYGVRLLPKGKRPDALHKAIDEVFDTDFSGRILVFDDAAADAYSEIATARKRAGHPIRPFDAMIAAIARSHGAALATRNTRDFVDCGIEVIDPWTAKLP